MIGQEVSSPKSHVPSPGNEPPAASPADPGPGTRDSGLTSTKPKPKFDQRYVAPILVSLILVVGNYTTGMLESPVKTGLAILTAIGLEIILGRLFTNKWPHLASAYISGISVGILIRSPYVWPYALCSAISILSKYVIRVKGRHIWNPSNFGVSAMLMLAPAYVASLSVQWDNKLWAMVPIWVLGSVIIGRLKRFHICATYVCAFLLFGALRSAMTGHPYLAEIAPITGPMYQLFIFFMITDPKTTVCSRAGQVGTVIAVAAVESFFRTGASLWGWEWGVHAPYYALFLVGPIANLIELYRKRD
jgi:enediyne biosynthesis protein E5